VFEFTPHFVVCFCAREDFEKARCDRVTFAAEWVDRPLLAYVSVGREITSTCSGVNACLIGRIWFGLLQKSIYKQVMSAEPRSLRVRAYDLCRDSDHPVPSVFFEDAGYCNATGLRISKASWRFLRSDRRR
jgi:hypothetical protein